MNYKTRHSSKKFYFNKLTLRCFFSSAHKGMIFRYMFFMHYDIKVYQRKKAEINS